MSLTLIKTIFDHLPDCQNWTAHLIAFHHSKRQESTYNCRLIELEPHDRVNSLIQEISSSYSRNNKNHLSKYTDVRLYDGTCNPSTIYKITETNCSVTIDLDKLLQGIANTDRECDPFQIKANAYVICGQLTLDNDVHQIKLISIASAIHSPYETG